MMNINLVNLQVPYLAELLITLLTNIRFLARMRSEMIFYILFFEKHSVAIVFQALIVRP